MKRNVRIFRYKRFDEYDGLCPVTLWNLNRLQCFVEITVGEVHSKVRPADRPVMDAGFDSPPSPYHNPLSHSLKQEPEGIDSAGYPCGVLEPPQGALQENSDDLRRLLLRPSGG